MHMFQIYLLSIYLLNTSHVLKCVILEYFLLNILLYLNEIQHRSLRVAGCWKREREATRSLGPRVMNNQYGHHAMK
jgi:hypothetical protein